MISGYNVPPNRKEIKLRSRDEEVLHQELKTPWQFLSHATHEVSPCSYLEGFKNYFKYKCLIPSKLTFLILPHLLNSMKWLNSGLIKPARDTSEEPAIGFSFLTKKIIFLEV